MKKNIYEIKPTKIFVMTLLSVMLTSLLYALVFIDEYNTVVMFFSGAIVIGTSTLITLVILRLSIRRVKDLEEDDN